MDMLPGTVWARVRIAALLLAIVGTGGWLLPQQLRASNEVMFFAATGQYVNNEHGFLAYWRAHDSERLLGAPVTGAMQEDGLVVQYFERARLEFHPQLERNQVLRGRIGADYTQALWRTFEPVPPGTATANDLFFEATGHTLREPFVSFWQRHDGIEAFGYPISEPLWEYIDGAMVRVQYFERGRLEHHPDATDSTATIQMSRLGYDLALLRGHEMAPAPPPAVATEPAAQPAAQPQATTNDILAEAAPTLQPMTEPVTEPLPQSSIALSPPVPEGGSMGGKHIVVSLTDQWLYAYEGDVLVFDAPVSTGRDGFNTPPGSFTIYSKVPLQTMSGTIGGESYSVPDVPHAMYIHKEVAMHGTYWHNQFGTGVRRSHGCINLPLNSAAWLYTWAPVGTAVQIY